MKNHCLAILISLIPLFAYTQEHPYTIVQEKVDGGVHFYCHNHSDVTTEVTFTLEKYKLIKGYSKPVTKRVSPGERKLFLEVTTSQGYSYTYQTSYLQTPTAEETAIANEQKVNELIKEYPGLNEGIVVFDKSGCTRCSYATNYLTEKGIDFRIIDVSSYLG